MAEKNLNEIPRDARVLFTKANEALQRDNLDYAIALFNQILEKEPGFFECRKALRAAQNQKAGGGGGFFKKMWSGAGSSPQVAKAKMAMSKNPAEAMAIAEQILNGDPNSSAGHRLIVEAAQALDLPQTAALSLETLVKNSPKDKPLIIEFARAIAAIGESGRAEILFERAIWLVIDAHAPLLLHYLPLRLEIRIVDVEASHAVRLEPQNSFEVVAREGLPKVRRVVASLRIVETAHRFDDAGMLVGAHVRVVLTRPGRYQR